MARHPRRIAAIAAAATAITAVAVATVIIGGSGAGPVAPQTPITPAKPLVLSPFTGEPLKALGPVLAVKIDNVAQARPPTGLARADIVYVLPVEGGLSRILAVFSAHFPRTIGPVRSAREDDIELLRMFGRPAFAYSGAQSHLLPVVERARIIDLYAGVAGGYFRDQNRVIPYNLYANAQRLLAESRGASRARDIGFLFGPPPQGGKATTAFSVAYPAASFGFRWSARTGRWLVSMDGSRAMSTNDGQLSAATVVIQHTTVRTSPYLERGVPPPYAESTGSGTDVVLRDGRAYPGRWSRPTADSVTTFTTATGQPMTFAPGPVWVVLVAAR